MQQKPKNYPYERRPEDAEEKGDYPDGEDCGLGPDFWYSTQTPATPEEIARLAPKQARASRKSARLESKSNSSKRSGKKLPQQSSRKRSKKKTSPANTRKRQTATKKNREENNYENKKHEAKANCCKNKREENFGR